MSATQRQCPDCKEWYDARSNSCYLCGEGERQRNEALVKAVETSRLNGALTSQVGYTQAEARAESELRAAHADKSGRAYASVRPRLPGYEGLVQGLKESLEERPDVLDYYGRA
jgi:hypothetical protein